MTRAKMSTVLNKGFKVQCKAVTSNFFTVISILFEPSTAIAKPKSYLEAYISTIQPPIKIPLTALVLLPPSLATSF